MKRIILLLSLLFILVGCSDMTEKHNKTIACKFEEADEDVVTYTELEAKYLDNTLVSGNIRSEMTYATTSYARVAYKIYEKQQDDEHQVELILDEDKVIMIVNYPSNNNAEYFIDQIRTLTLHGACTTTVEQN